LVSFDEVGEEIARNLASVNIHLTPYQEQGLLTIQALRTEARSAEEHLLHLKSLIETRRPRCMVIDPITALVKAGGLAAALTVVQRLVRLTKSHGITLLCTSLTESSDPLTEAGAIQISTILDTWIHLSYSIKGGERNRALTIIKSRGTKHSDQVRELILSDTGVTLTDVYTERGEVLMGTLREERMTEEAFERERQRLEFERLQRARASDAAALTKHIDALQQELQAKQEGITLAQQEHAAREQQLHRQRKIRQTLRGGDKSATADGEGEARDA
jgi:circadian clock protein KaiC